MTHLTSAHDTHSRETSTPLQIALNTLTSDLDVVNRVANDPIHFPKSFKNALDQEIVALFAALLAYGRVSAIGQAIQSVLDVLSDSPSDDIIQDAQLRRKQHSPPSRFQGFVYRFTRESDLQKLWVGVGEVILRYGSIGQCFRAHLQPEDSTLINAYQGFYHDVLTYSEALSGGQGFNHFFSDPSKGSALKRINMWLRWMVRGPDEIDLGIWNDLGPQRLLIPLDVHVFRLSQAIGLTKRRSANLKTAIEITEALKHFDPQDPIKYDFALAHLGISGACKGYKVLNICTNCPLESLCTLK